MAAMRPTLQFWAALLFLVDAGLSSPKVSAETPSLSFGGRVGLSANTLSGGNSSPQELNARFGASGGVFVGLRWGQLDFTAGSMVSSRGAEFDRGRTTGSVALYYLEFPLTAGMAFPFANNAFEARGYGGVSLGYRLAADLRDSANPSENLMASTRHVDAGVLAGAGLTLAPLSDALLLDLQVYLGLRGVEDGSAFLGTGHRNRSITFLFGFQH